MNAGMKMLVSRTVGGAALILGGLFNQAAAETITYIHTDALGSPVAETDAAGSVIRRTTYEPYGAVVGGSVADGPGYAGHVSDASTGLSYMQQRYMDPILGVFLSVDPVSPQSDSVGAFGRYRYANSNPYRYFDPDGRRACGKDTDCQLEQGAYGGSSAGRGTMGTGAVGSRQSTSASPSYGRSPQSTDPAWTRDPGLKRQMERAWQDSNPDAPTVLWGQPGSLKREQGGWIVAPNLVGAPQLIRAQPGTRAQMGQDVLFKPSEFQCGCRVIGFFHTHPNTREEGYRPAANGYDYQFLEEMGVPGMIRSHEGYEFVPIMEGGR